MMRLILQAQSDQNWIFSLHILTDEVRNIGRVRSNKLKMLHFVDHIFYFAKSLLQNVECAHAKEVPGACTHILYYHLRQLLQ